MSSTSWVSYAIRQNRNPRRLGTDKNIIVLFRPNLDSSQPVIGPGEMRIDGNLITFSPELFFFLIIDLRQLHQVA